MVDLPPDSYPEERRLATVLVAYLDGFSRRPGHGNFDIVDELLKEAWRVIDRVIQESGGFIETHTGDEVRVVWGAPVSGEDDAERAVSTAMNIEAALRAFAVDSLHPDAQTIHLRVGVNSGPVLALYIGLDNQYRIVGEALDAAKKLALTAEPKQVLIGEQTYRLVRGAFRVTSLGVINEEDEAPPITGFRVEEKLLQPTRVRYTDQGGLETHMVARDAEMEMLEAMFEEANSQGSPRLALVVGDTGMGKSRLLAEVSRQLELENSRLHSFSARGLAEAEKAPFFLWKALWKHRFGIQESMDVEATRENFMRGILQIWGNRLGAVSAIEAAHMIGQLVGIEWENSPYLEDLAAQPERRKQRAFELTRELFSRLSETGPVLLMVDDLQWVDRGSLDLMAYLAQDQSTTLPLFILAGARSEFPKANVQWLNIANLVPLRPIPFDATLVKAAYPALVGYPDAFLSGLGSRSEGNPYFLEELVKSIVQSEGNYDAAPRVPPEAVATNLPQNLRALLQERLDALPSDAREVLLLASVVGRMFWVGAIKAAAKQPIGTGLLNLPEEVLDRVVQNALRHLVRAEMAFPRADSIFADQQEFIFKHAMLREVAYDLLPQKYRRFYHFAIARWLSKRAGPDFHVMIAGHYEQAGGISAALRHYNLAVKYAEASGAEEDIDWLKNRIESIQSGEKDDSGVQRTNPA